MPGIDWNSLPPEIKERFAKEDPELAAIYERERQEQENLVAKSHQLLYYADQVLEASDKALEKIYERNPELKKTEERDTDHGSQPPSWVRQVLETIKKSEEPPTWEA